ncbi:PoNi-like cognate immunity protein [Breznakiellaceae bacterium SP9]
MIRDTIKTEEYFVNFIEEDNNRINKFIENIEIGNTKEERIPAVLRKVFNLSIGVMVAGYSAGKSKDDIIKKYNKAIQFMENGLEKTSGYVQALWLISIAILLNINNDEFNKLVKIIDEKGIEDYLINYLISFRIKDRKITEKITFKEPYKRLIDIINVPDKRNECIKVYLKDVWYNGHKDCYWHNNHKSKENIYFGYWSFETGAIVKILNIDDTDFKDCKYYPYDMVHW